LGPGHVGLVFSLRHFSLKETKLLQDGAKEGIHDAGEEEEVEDVAAEEGRGGVEEGAGVNFIIVL